jgi:hypothetical protein
VLTSFVIRGQVALVKTFARRGRGLSVLLASLEFDWSPLDAGDAAYEPTVMFWMVVTSSSASALYTSVGGSIGIGVGIGVGIRLL